MTLSAPTSKASGNFLLTPATVMLLYLLICAAHRPMGRDVGIFAGVALGALLGGAGPVAPAGVDVALFYSCSVLATSHIPIMVATVTSASSVHL